MRASAYVRSGIHSGCHPSPSNAARCRAAALLPPTHSGTGDVGVTTESPSGLARPSPEKLLRDSCSGLIRSHPQSVEFSPQVANTDTEDEPVDGQSPEGSGHSGHDQGMAIGGDQHIGAEPQSIGETQTPRTCGQWFEDRRGKHVRRVVRQGDVVGEPGGVEPELVGGDE